MVACAHAHSILSADSGADWTEELLPSMREGISQFMDDAADDASLSVQDSIIVASLTSITGKDSQRIKAMFLDSGKTDVLSFKY